MKKEYDLGHVAAEPKEPATGCSDDQTNLIQYSSDKKVRFWDHHLNDRFVGTSGHQDRQEDTDDPPDGREDGHGEDRGPHDDALEEHTHFIVILISTSKLPSL